MESASRADSSRAGRIRAVLRLPLLRNAYNAPAAATPAVVFVLAMVAFATWLGIDWLGNQSHPSFYGYGISGIAWYVVGILLIAAVAARRSTPRLTLDRAVVIVLAVVPVEIGWGYVISAQFAQPWAAVGAVAACVYFVGFAGYGEQRVFAEEIRLAQRVDQLARHRHLGPLFRWVHRLSARSVHGGHRRRCTGPHVVRR